MSGPWPQILGALLAIGASVGMCARSAEADAPPRSRDPYVGYAYPAGGERGSVFQLRTGGQNLRGVTGVHVSGTGVRGSIVRYEGAYRRLNGDQRRELGRLLRVRRAELRGEEPRKADQRPAAKDVTKALPKHPLLDILGTLDEADLDRIESSFLVRDPRRQPNAQIAETVLIAVTIEPDAATGDRDLRLITRSGLTNPVRIQVGALPEVREPPPPVARARAGRGGGKRAPVVASTPLPDRLLETPVLLNGQVLPGEVDRFRIHARGGQRLVFAASARRLVPYLADAVPGWFQATLTLRDADGAEVGFADDHQFDPDPVLLCEIPRDGEYVLEVADAIYRGREDFVYRITVAEQPFVTQMFPLGCRAGSTAAAQVAGWNLPSGWVPLDTRPADVGVRSATPPPGATASDRLPYAVDTLPECREVEPDDGAEHDQPIQLPRIVNGRIGRPGDSDTFRFEGRAGERIVAEVQARRLRSPLDSLLRIVGPDGEVVAWNDDYVDPAAGYVTHHADSYLAAALPATGTYRVRISDAQRHGGPEYAYRLRIGHPRPDFDVIVTPSTLNVRAGRAIPVTVHVLRRDGFAGEVGLILADAPEGFSIQGGTVPAGRDRIRVTLTAPRRRFDAPVALRIGGTARIRGREVIRTAVPAQHAMQAFLYRHLAASEQLLVCVLGGGGGTPVLELPGEERVRLPLGGSVEVVVMLEKRARDRFEDLALHLIGPPAGVTVSAVTEILGGVTFVLSADRDASTRGEVGNLILEASAAGPARGKGRQRRRISLGHLPAIPFEIARR